MNKSMPIQPWNFLALLNWNDGISNNDLLFFAFKVVSREINLAEIDINQ